MEFENKNGKLTLCLSQAEKFIADPTVYGVNRLEHRATNIPSAKRDIYYINKFDSTYLLNLDGDYKFILMQADDGKEEYFSKDYDDSCWDIIDVPSMWQYRGYGFCTYPNVQYHFPFDPPHIDCENPVGIYRRKFVVSELSERSILHFSGVDNAFFVYVNGRFAGFGKGSRNACEFDVTELLVKGENTLAVKVYTWSDASYLENQDMLLSNGIFREVYLINTAKVSVWDYYIRTDTENMYFTVKLNDSDETTSVRITADGRTLEIKPENNVAKADFHIQNPRLWTAETPECYETYIELCRNGEVIEIHSKRVGLCTSRVEGNKLLVNDKKIMLKGANRHEHNMKDGKAISIAQMEKEVKLLKQFNVNAVRCSHYTNSPAFYELCLKYGIYIMDEADIESHGAEMTKDQGALAKMKEWEYAFLFRTRAMVENNKNETCIIIWSIGNECGSGPNIEECAKYLHSLDEIKPIHQSQDSPMNPKFDDFRKNGYCTFASMDNYGVDGKPIVLTEYAHGMGNAPGCLEDYWDYMYSHEQYCGGFVWEFKSHGFYCVDENGEYFVKYGGDFSPSEKNHWRNFTLDGYFRSDLTPKPAAFELKEALSPVHVKLENGKVVVTNTNDFRGLSYLTLNWSLLCDCNAVRCGSLRMPDIKARQSDVLDIDTTIENAAAGAVYRLDFVFTDGANEVSHRQIVLENNSEKSAFIPSEYIAKINTNKSTLEVSGDDFKVKFDKGIICEYEAGGKTLISRPMKFSFFRALIDNDDFRRSGASKWESTRLPQYEFFTRSVEAEKKAFETTVTTRGKTTAQGQYSGFEWEIVCHIFAHGILLFDMNVKPYGFLTDKLLRIGVEFELDKSFDKVDWYGRGKNECYVDRKLSCPFGFYSDKLPELNFRYEMPQECGTRIDTYFLAAKSDDAALNVIGCDRFSFSLHNCTTDALNKAMHANEVVKDKYNHLHIDYAMRGLGNHSCGPEPETQYELYPHSFEFAFVLFAGLDKDSMLEMSRQDFGVKSHKVTDKYTTPSVEEIVQMFDCKDSML